MSAAYTAVARELPETAVFKKADYTVNPAEMYKLHPLSPLSQTETAIFPKDSGPLGFWVF